MVYTGTGTPLSSGFASVGRGGGGRDFSFKMPRTMSNFPDFPRRPFLYAHLCFYTKSMVSALNGSNASAVWPKVAIYDFS